MGRASSRVLFVVLSALVVLMLPAVSAHASSCHRDGDELGVTVSGSHAKVRLADRSFTLWVGKSADDLAQLSCDVEGVRHLTVDATGPATTIGVAWVKGPLPRLDTFTIGFQPPPTESVENGAYAAGERRLTVTGRSGAGDDFRFGSAGGDLNNDGDIDIVANGMTHLVLNGRSGADMLRATGGNGTGSALQVPVTINGGSYPDVLAGGAGHNRLSGGAGPDHFKVRPAGETINGGVGADTIHLPESSGFSVNLRSGTLAEHEATNASTVRRVENVVGTKFADILIGNISSNRLEGRRGDDLLRGRRGPDVLLGGEGTDTCHSGRGADLVHSCEVTNDPREVVGSSGGGDFEE